MPERPRNPETQERLFNEFIVAEYLKHGSVDAVYRAHLMDLPISYPQFHRVLHEWGIVKAAGPHTELPLSLSFLRLMARERLPLERLYRQNHRFWDVSLSTLHRILRAVKEGTTRRSGTALVVTPKDNPNLILIGRETTADPRVGKQVGSLSVPMTYAKRREDPRQAILRVLQQEVFTELAVKRSLPEAVVPREPSVLMTVQIADVRVNVYRVVVPQELEPHLSSFKLSGLDFLTVQEVAADDSLESPFRAGVPEIALGYYQSRFGSEQETLDQVALLNRTLAMIYA